MTEPGLSGRRLCEGRICVITGAGRGIGREYALMLAEHGAQVVVNDLGGDRTGSGADAGPAQQVVDEITGAGGAAVANTDDISTWAGAKALVDQAIEVFGGLDVVINNAGILRDRMLVNMSEEEWDSVIRVHLKGTFAVSRHAAAYWRDRTKAGETNDARIINTTSVSGIYGNVGQANYGAAKAGIAGLTIIAARELGRYGVTVNAIAPGALTRMTEDLPIADDVKAALDPRWVAPVCVWLASTLSSDVTEQVIEVSGTNFAIAEGWHRGPTGTPIADPAEVDAAIRKLLADARPHMSFAETTNQQKRN
ncbi:MAG: SDR family oxidoreductase [Actinomycetota bacterium]|jgi:NAD(P)-dependent dehydrogenase (short-subunit alcohol dehydrogenase family)